MKRSLALILCVFMLIPIIFCSCSQKDDSGKIKILCTLFPQYDWVRNIVGDSENIEVSLLIHNGADPHSYQPTASDILKISNCDMLVLTGGDSDTWIKDALEKADDPDILKIALTDIPSMTLHDISSSSGEHSHGSEKAHGHEGHSHGTLDEHVWLSLKNAIAATMHLSDVICRLDKENEGKYIKNTSDYVTKLSALDLEFRSTVSAVEEDKRFMIFADRFPFIYLLEDYGIGYQAAFDGCSADVDAGFDTVATLICEVNEHNVQCIAVTESSDKSLANTVATSADRDGIQVITMRSMQSVTRKSIDEGITYLSEMRANLEQIKLALSQ